MVTGFMRDDDKKGPVKVEIWRDDKTGEIVRIKRIVRLCFANKEFYHREDFYQETNPEEFRKVLVEEIAQLVKYQDIMRELLLSPEDWIIKMEPMLKSRGEKLDEEKRATRQFNEAKPE